MLISADSCVRVWNQQNTSLAYTFDVGVNKINDISFTRDGRILFVASDTDRIQVIDLYKTENPPEIIVSKDKSKDSIKVTSIGCSTDGQKIGVGTSSGVINVFNTITHEKIFSNYVHRKPITSICFDPSAKYVIASDTKGKMSYSSLNGGPPKMLPHWTSKCGEIFEFDSSPHRPILAVASSEGIILYNLEKMIKESPNLPKFGGHPTHIRFSPKDPNVIAFSTSINEVYFFNMSSKSLSSPIVFEDNILSMDYQNRGVFLAISFAKTGIVTIDVSNSSIQHKYCTDNTNLTYIVKFQPVDINEDPKFKQTIVIDAPKITKPTIQSSKSSDSRKFPATNEKKKTNTFSRVVQAKNQKVQPNKIAKIEDKSDDLDVKIESNKDDLDDDFEMKEAIDPKFDFDINEKADILPKKTIQNPNLASNLKENLKQKTNQSSVQKGNTQQKQNLPEGQKNDIQLKPKLPSPLKNNKDTPKSPKRNTGSPKEPSSPKQKHNLSVQKQQQANAQSSPLRPPPQTSLPTNAPHIIHQDDESDDEEIDLSKVPAESREIVKAICYYMKEMNETTKEELHQHLNTIHLDLLCRIRELDDKVNMLMQKMNIK